MNTNHPPTPPDGAALWGRLMGESLARAADRLLLSGDINAITSVMLRGVYNPRFKRKKRKQP